MVMRWRFDHEDDCDVRTRMHLNGAKGWEELSGHQREYAIADTIEDWAENEMGSWENGDYVKVVVLDPPNMAGTYDVSLQVSCSAVAYHKASEDEPTD